MKRSHIVSAFLVLAIPILQLFHQPVAEAQLSEDLRGCIAKFEKIRTEAAKIKPVNLSPFLQDYQKLGYRDKKGRVLISPRFTEAQQFYQGRAVVADRNWYKGFINSQGQLVIPYKFVWVSDFANGIAVFSGTRENREQLGFIDLNGNIVLTFNGTIPYPDFIGFDKSGRVKVYMHDLSDGGYGNPIRTIGGYVDCTGKVTLER